MSKRKAEERSRAALDPSVRVASQNMAGRRLAAARAMAFALPLCLLAYAWSRAAAAESHRVEILRPVDPALSGQIGLASWYGKEHAGRPMANGEIFDPNLLTAAHRALPLGTRLRVTLLATGRSIIAVITDRGPYVRRRFIDLSQRAAQELGMTKTGLARVRIEILPKQVVSLAQ
jgi:rare lipoprotein A